MTARLLTAALLAWCAPLSAANDTYCAFEVKVLSPSNGPASKVPVGIARLSNTFAETVTDANGIARICDAPIDPVDVFIGFDACGLIVIKGVKPLWLETKRLFATYATSSCGEFNSNPKNCHIMLRVKDESGRPVAEARFEGNASESVREPIVGDSFGRLFRTVERDRTLQGSITKLGYNPTPISQRCVF
jgi:hypothetical protein